MKLVKLYAKSSYTLHRNRFCFSDLFAVVVCLGKEGLFAVTNSFCNYRKTLIFDVRIIFHALYIICGHVLKPNALPDSRGAAVIAAVRFVSAALLSAGLLFRAACIVCANDNDVVFISQSVGDIKRK